MLKVIIADDEPRVCKLLQMLADWNTLDMEVAGTAANGLEALELIETVQPDILITDIRMPGCDGLDLIEQAKRLSPHLQIAIISGYAQFEYAQAAIRYGVGGYLLKPIKKEALMSTLERLGEQCRQYTDSATTIEQLRSQSQGMLFDKLVEDLLQGRFPRDTWEQLAEEHDLADKGGLLQLFILKLDFDAELLVGAPMPILYKKAEEIFETTLLPVCFSGLLHFKGSAGYGVFHFARESQDEARRALRNLLNQMQAQKPLFPQMEFSLAIGGAVDSAADLPLSMGEAQKALAERLVEGNNRLLESVLPPSGIRIQPLLDKYSRGIGYAVDSLSVAEADKALAELISELERMEGVRGYELLDLVLSIGRMFALRVSTDQKTGILNEFEEACALCGSAERLFACLRDFQACRLERMRQQHESEAIRPIRLAKQYVQQHYSEPVTLEDVCAAIGFSVSYFSTLFKKETGEGFSKYITRVRIEQAKILLQDTDLSVAEICGRVGYSDLKHFTGTFKKATSLSPGQYRKLYG